MYLAKAVSTWDNLSYQTFITGYNAELVTNWEKATLSTSLYLPSLPTCCFPSMRQATTSEAKWILADLKMTKTVSERPISSVMEEILDVRRITKTYDMRVLDDEDFKLIGMEKDGQPNLSPAGPGPRWTDVNRARFLTFHLITLANPDKKLAMVNENYPLAASMEEIINFREAFYTKRVGEFGPVNLKQKTPRLDNNARGPAIIQIASSPATSTPNTSTRPAFVFNNSKPAENYSLDEDVEISESQLFLTASALPEVEDEELIIVEDPEGEDEKKEEIA